MATRPGQRPTTKNPAVSDRPPAGRGASGSRPQGSGSSRSTSGTKGRSTGSSKSSGSSSATKGSGEKVYGGARSKNSRSAPSRAERASNFASDEWKRAVTGRENEVGGIALVVAGLLAGVAIYAKLAGPVGRGISDAFAWVGGVGRYVAPIGLVAIGVALIRKRRSERRARLTIGTTVLLLAVLGLVHLVRGPEKFSWTLEDVESAGGWVGAATARAFEVPLATAGAVVILLGLLVLGSWLISGRSFMVWATSIRSGTQKVATPIGKAARKALGEVSTLSSERDGSGGRPRIYDAEADLDEPLDAPKPKRSKGPGVFDDAAETASGLPAGSALPPPLAPPKPRAKKATAGGPGEQTELALGPGAERGKWKLPSADSLSITPAHTVDKAAVVARGNRIVEALAAHNVFTEYAAETVGPTVTRYELSLETTSKERRRDDEGKLVVGKDGKPVYDEVERIAKISSLTSLQRDIAYAAAASDVRILAPIPGRSAVGIEVPNHDRQLVSLGDALFAKEAKAATHPLDVAIGKDIAGRAVFLNLATTPHLLIAGATGAGKSSGINCIITSLLMRTTPDQVRLILIDPKQVEMGQYNRLPHLLTQPVTNPKKAANALAWACKEMERRYDVLFEVGFRDISGYNAAYDRGELVPEPGTDKEFERLPYIVVVVDELNDLMMVAARDVEESITRIAQKARAVGIHLIVATQRPSVNVITGVIKANVPARMAFAVSSQTDSRVILDQPGAEKLIGKGDLLLLPGNSSVAQRIQGCFVSEDEVRKVVAHWRRQAPEVSYVAGVEGDDNSSGSSGSGGYGSSGGGGDEDEDEALMRQAMDLVVRSQLGSTSMLQRKLKVGFARAGRLMDLLENRGVVGPSEGSKARAVLMTVEELDLIQESER
jgi:DNA segregation ATPase FtsK/SpoIIIE, S-DNA-T family